MSKGFGKIVLISSVIAGAAVGTIAYLKKEGVIGQSDSVAKDLADKVSADAADIIAEKRNYVDLGDATPESEEAYDDSETEFEPGIQAKNIEATDDKIIGSSTSEELFNDEEEA